MYGLTVRLVVSFALFLAPAHTWAQDDCTSAVPITPGLTAASTASYATGTTTACGTSHKDIWFLYVPACSGLATATLCNPGSATFDAILAAFDGANGCAALVPLACNDNTCGNRPEIMFPVVLGGTYYLTIGGVAGASGSFGVSVSCAPVGSPDECTGAIPIGNGLTSGSNVGATTSPQTASCGNMGSDVWYAYTASCTGVADATFCSPGNATFDTALAVFDATGGCAAPSLVACNDDTCLLLSKATFPVVAGSTYYLAVGGFAGQQGVFSILITCQPAPSNDDCAAAITLVPGTNGPFSNLFASDGAASSACGAQVADVWFSLVSACGGRFRIDTCGTGYDTILAVTTGCGTGEIACNDDDPTGACGSASRVEIDAAALTDYRVRVGRGGTGAGSFNVTVTAVPVLTYASPFGAGSIGFAVSGGPAGGNYLNAVTFVQGSFPNGPFFGVDITVATAFDLLALGYPFTGSLDACGVSVFPPLADPALSGLTVYSVAVTWDAALVITTSAPVSYLIP